MIYTLENGFGEMSTMDITGEGNAMDKGREKVKYKVLDTTSKTQISHGR